MKFIYVILGSTIFVAVIVNDYTLEEESIMETKFWDVNSPRI